MIIATPLVKDGVLTIGRHITAQSSATLRLIELRGYDSKIVIQLGSDKPAYQHVSREDLLELADVFITVALELSSVEQPKPNRYFYAPPPAGFNPVDERLHYQLPHAPDDEMAF